MFMVGLISWWYGRGWVAQWRRIKERYVATLDFFSIGQLLATYFSPFRQISAGGGSGTAFQAMIDQLISRVIGSIVRFFTIIAGLAVILFLTVYELIIMTCWWFLPVLPVVGLMLFAIGWVPGWM